MSEKHIHLVHQYYFHVKRISRGVYLFLCNVHHSVYDLNIWFKHIHFLYMYKYTYFCTKIIFTLYMNPNSDFFLMHFGVTYIVYECLYLILFQPMRKRLSRFWNLKILSIFLWTQHYSLLSCTTLVGTSSVGIIRSVRIINWF